MVKPWHKVGGPYEYGTKARARLSLRMKVGAQMNMAQGRGPCGAFHKGGGVVKLWRKGHGMDMPLQEVRGIDGRSRVTLSACVWGF